VTPGTRPRRAGVFALVKCIPVLAIALAPALAVGCDGCHKEKPYTPFGVVSALPSASVAAADAAVDEDAGASDAPRFVARPAITAPAGATRWMLDGRDLDAPAGRVFERGLVADFDGDDKNEIVAFTVKKDGATAPAAAGELWLYPRAGAAKKLAELPGFVPIGPTCRHEPTLAQTGPRSVTLDVHALCTATLLPRAPTRALLVVAPLRERPVVVGVRVADPAPGETLKLVVDSEDRDGDGRDDVNLGLTVAASGSERPGSASLIWLDRAAGTSRDASEPAASLARLAATNAVLSQRKKLSKNVRSGVANARRLLATLCAEGGVPRLYELDGAPFKCGKLGSVVDRLLDAEIRSALADSDVPGAFAARARDGWYYGHASDKAKKAADKLLLARVTPFEAPKLVPIAARPPARGKAPRFSPLAFEPGATSLLIQTGHDLVRADGTGHEEALGEAGSPWPLAITRADGARVTQVFAPCDNSGVEIALADASGAALPPLSTSLLAPRPGTCAGGPGISLTLDPLAFKNDGLEAFISGDWVGPKSTTAEAVLRPRVMGAARSPDGKLAVSSTPLGVLVTGGPKPELWRVDEPGASECAVADGDQAIACLDGGAVKLWLRP
jgi:hypothetical protein